MTGPIEALWGEIPDANCRGLCSASCGPIGAGTAERARILARHGLAIGDVTKPLPMVCPALAGDRCTVYSDRPTLCRIFGSVEDLPCPHGCQPTFGRLPAVVGRDLMARSMTLPPDPVC